jgi:DDE superfamily endonuclease
LFDINSLQIGNTPSNLHIADYSHGLTGSAHDAAAFQHTTAVKHPEILFEGEEFAWTDLAYAVNFRTISVHKRPASLDPANALFDRVLAQLRVQSEHCMGALKGRFQSLHGLRVNINSNLDHARALRWVTVAIILHNLIIDVEGDTFAVHFAGDHGQEEEFEDRGGQDEARGDDDEAQGAAKRHQLVAELIAHHAGPIDN